MGMFGAIGNAIKGGLKPNLVKKMLPGMGGPKQGTAQKLPGGGIGPSPSGFSGIAQGLMNKNPGLSRNPQMGGMKPQMQPFNPGMQMPQKSMPPDIPPMSGEGMEPVPYNNPNTGVFGPMPGGVDSGMNIRPPAPNPMGMNPGMGPSPQGMEQLLAKMRARNTGISGRM